MAVQSSAGARRCIGFAVAASLALMAACVESKSDGGGDPPPGGLADSGPWTSDDGGGGGGDSGSPPRDDAGSEAEAGKDAGGGGGTSGCGLPERAGTTTEKLVMGAEERSYMLVVPAGVDGRTPVPVIFGFHGGTGTSQDASRYGLTGTEAALYVYPQANMHPTAGGVAWELETTGDDIPFIDAIVVELGKKHCVDTKRVFAAGQSNGAYFTNLLGCHRPNTFRAIAPAAGGGPWTQCTKSVGAMVVHGTADRTVEIENGRASRDYWLKANGCAGAPSQPTEPSPCVAYTGCAKPVVWCEHGGGHPWPNFAGAGIRRFFLTL